MNIDNLQRNPEKVHAALKEVGNSLVATKRCKIYIPEHYSGAFLGSIEDEVRMVGIFGIVVEDAYYAASRVCAMMQLDPSSTTVIDINGENYLEFTFEIGDTVIKNLNLVKQSTLSFRIYDELIAKGKVPWYLSYEDMCFLFDTSKDHADASLNVDSAILEMIASSMARSKGSKNIFYRHVVKTAADVGKVDFVYVPLRSVAYGATNTTAKISGAYFQEGMTSALLTPSERNETIEELLRR